MSVNDTGRLTIVLLAAGDGQRFGGDKLRYPVEGVTMIKRAVDVACRLPYPLVLVTQPGPIAAWAADQYGKRMTIVKNEHSEWGVAHSIEMAIQARPEAEAYLFMVCDQPYLKASTVLRLIDAYQTGEKGIVAVAHGDRLGNPVIFGKQYREALLALEGDIRCV